MLFHLLAPHEGIKWPPVMDLVAKIVQGLSIKRNLSIIIPPSEK
jgi:hypothetical protein